MTKGARHLIGIALAAVWMLAGCSGTGLPSRYIAAEKLWTQKKYAAAAAEFDDIARLDPDGPMGLQSLYRSAQTKTLFLSRHNDAIEQFKLVIERAPKSEVAYSAIREVGETYYSRLSHCAQSIQWYSQFDQDPRVQQADSLEFLLRRGRCHHRLRELGQSNSIFDRMLSMNLPKGLKPKVLQEQGSLFLSRGEQDSKFSELAKKTFEQLEKDYPNSEFSFEAIFGVASALEQMGQLDEALVKYTSLQSISSRVFGRDLLIGNTVKRLRARIEKKNLGKSSSGGRG
jgi:tetratricopeptide (TPR) repeat protein